MPTSDEPNRRRAPREDVVRGALDLARLLRSVDEGAKAGADVEMILSNAATCVARHGGWAEARVLLVRDAGALDWRWTWQPDDDPRAARVRQLSSRNEDARAAEAARARDSRRAVRAPGGVVRDSGLASCSIPVVSHGEVLGVVQLIDLAPREIDDDLLELLSFVGEHVGRQLERVRSAAQARAADERIRDLIDHSPYPYIGLDESGRVVDVNEAAERAYSWDREDVLGRSFVDELLAPAARDEVRDGLRRFVAGQDADVLVRRLEVAVLCGNGGEAPVAMTIVPMPVDSTFGFWVFARDLTEPQAMERALRESEARWRLLAQNVPDYILIVDAEGRIRFVNRIFPEYSYEEVIGSRVARWIPPGHEAPLNKALERAFGAGEASTFPFYGAAPNGGFAWYECSVTPIVQDGEVVEATLIARDVTPWREAERRLRESERMFAEAYRRERDAAEELRAINEMKNLFLAAVSHELKSPLTAVIGYANLLLRRFDDLPAEQRATMLADIVDSGKKLERLLADLLDLDRLQRGRLEAHREPVDVGELARAVVAETAREEPVTVDVEQVVVAVDAAKVERILENLVSNALRHSPQQTPVWVRVRARDGGVLIVVEDAGPGVPEPVRRMIFEPFRRGEAAEAQTPGTGIGLALVARFAELHGGHAWVEEREGGGASFRVFLPGHAQAPRNVRAS